MRSLLLLIFFFNDTATTEIYTLSLHDALPIFVSMAWQAEARSVTATSSGHPKYSWVARTGRGHRSRSEEHTSELQSQSNLVCRLLLEKKKKNICTKRTTMRQARRRDQA